MRIQTIELPTKYTAEDSTTPVIVVISEVAEHTEDQVARLQEAAADIRRTSDVIDAVIVSNQRVDIGPPPVEKSKAELLDELTFKSPTFEVRDETHLFKEGLDRWVRRLCPDEPAPIPVAWRDADLPSLKNVDEAIKKLAELSTPNKVYIEGSFPLKPQSTFAVNTEGPERVHTASSFFTAPLSTVGAQGIFAVNTEGVAERTCQPYPVKWVNEQLDAAGWKDVGYLADPDGHLFDLEPTPHQQMVEHIKLQQKELAATMNLTLDCGTPQLCAQAPYSISINTEFAMDSNETLRHIGELFGYRGEELEQWLDDHTFTSTVDVAEDEEPIGELEQILQQGQAIIDAVESLMDMVSDAFSARGI